MEKENLNPTPDNENITNAEEITAEPVAEEAVQTEEPAEVVSPESAEEVEQTEPEQDGNPDDASENPALSETDDDTVTDNEELPAEYTYTPRRSRKKSKDKNGDKKSFKARTIIIPLVIVALLCAGFFALPFTLDAGVIARNVYVNGLDLSGLTKEEAEKLISTEYTPTQTNFSVVFETETKSVSAKFTAEEIEFASDIKGTAADAYNFGRSGNILENSWNILRSLVMRADIGVRPSFNEETLSKILYDLGAKVHGQGEDVKIVIENNTLSITPATPGQSHNVDDAILDFTNGVRRGQTYNIPVTLRSNQSDTLNADKLYKELSCEAKDAEYEIVGNEVIITDHVVGVKIDKAKLSALVEQVNAGIAGTIDVVQTIPEITTESIQASLFGTTLATFSSNYASSSANRAYNVELAASKINGYILPPDAEFSYNELVGNANAANGFKMATIFADGKKTEGVGGGVCQVSSTLYCSVLRADLAVTERHNHSLPISYVPGGQDATVSYGVLDFKFKNNTGAPIKIVATSSSRTLTVSILGSAEAKKNVEIVSQKLSSVAPEMKETPDPSLPAGTTKIVSKGSYGSVYVAYKRVFDANGKLISETSTKSTYRATPGEVLVGTATAQTPLAPDVPTDVPPSENDIPVDTPPVENESPVIKPDGYPEGL